ncbi:SGNH/GDSL hydrolase family protein [Rhodococcus tibetensis]|uniref:SGNH/GDSL hydrolase family protein n=1 Tax=Rhodococcus tibetensis TaxID=2965064 RepID=A0ABT1QCA2_9NOCA|nr:SGNH/GDSL hydrolase family protein [Rhodococcus sp. FXJ9.536]MCQ4119903.1 SGNH/GDSL hydrolase family protein [Rhodococcus sp. FXJ9.536]
MPLTNRKPTRTKRTPKAIALWTLIAITPVAVAAGFAWDTQRGAVSADRISGPPPVADFTPPQPDPAVVTRPDGGPLKVLFLGDSLTYGLYASNDAAGYRPQLVEAIREGGPVEERTAEQVGGKVADIKPQSYQSGGYSLAVVELGTNDVNRTDLPTFETNYRNLLTSVRASSPDVEFLCAGTWQDPKLGEPYDLVIERLCLENGGAYVDLSSLFLGEGYRGPADLPKHGGISDNFHPNDFGYTAISDALLYRLEIA